MSTKNNLTLAKIAKNDEFYTRYEDIEAELCHYTEYFKDKVVYINCDVPEKSNFWKYFIDNFSELKLKKLMCSWYKLDGNVGGYCEYTGGDYVQIRFPADGEGDFRNLDYEIKMADIVVGNPPFSLFREFVSKCVRHRKKFLIVGSINAIVYKEVFPLIKDNRIRLGYNKVKDFYTDKNTKKGVSCYWYTNLSIQKTVPFLTLTKKYNPDDYPKYDNYDAIEVKKTADIPCDYNGIMGVPVTFLDKYNHNQFKIIDMAKSWAGNTLRTKIYKKQLQHNADGSVEEVTKLNDTPSLKYDSVPSKFPFYEVEGSFYKALYARILIQRIS